MADYDTIKGRTPGKGGVGGSILIDYNEWGLSIRQNSRRNLLLALRGLDTKKTAELFQRTFDLALEGDKDARKIIFPYIFGNPTIELDVSGGLDVRDVSVGKLLTPDQKLLILERIKADAEKEKAERDGTSGRSLPGTDAE